MIDHRSYAHNLSSCEVTFPFYGYITTPQSSQLPCSWLGSSASRALHWYRRGHGVESRSGLNFVSFLRFNFATELCAYWLRWSIISSYHSPQFKYMKFHIFTHKVKKTQLLHRSKVTRTNILHFPRNNKLNLSKNYWSKYITWITVNPGWVGIKYIGLDLKARTGAAFVKSHILL